MDQRVQRLLEKLLSGDSQMIKYRPQWKNVTGSVTATILLSQLYYRWIHNDKKPFYKFKEPCSHAKYREGDSWCEELGFSRSEFDGALKRIGQKRSEAKEAKMSPGDRADLEQHLYPVEFWTDRSRVTFYTIHEENFYRMMWNVYDVEDESAQNDTISQKHETNFSKSGNPTLAKAEKVILQNQDSDDSKSKNAAFDYKTKIPNKEDTKNTPQQGIGDLSEEWTALLLLAQQMNFFDCSFDSLRAFIRAGYSVELVKAAFQHVRKWANFEKLDTPTGAVVKLLRDGGVEMTSAERSQAPEKHSLTAYFEKEMPVMRELYREFPGTPEEFFTLQGVQDAATRRRLSALLQESMNT